MRAFMLRCIFVLLLMAFFLLLPQTGEAESANEPAAREESAAGFPIDTGSLALIVIVAGALGGIGYWILSISRQQSLNFDKAAQQFEMEMLTEQGAAQPFTTSAPEAASATADSQEQTESKREEAPASSAQMLIDRLEAGGLMEELEGQIAVGTEPERQTVYLVKLKSGKSAAVFEWLPDAAELARQSRRWDVAFIPLSEDRVAAIESFADFVSRNVQL